MRALLEGGAEVDGSPAQHQLVWLMGHYQQVTLQVQDCG